MVFRWLILPYGSIALLYFLLRLPTFFLEYLNVDEIAQYLQVVPWSENILLDDVWFMCRPLLYLFYQVAVFLFQDSTIGLHLIATVVLMMTGWMLLAIGNLLDAPKTGWIASALFGILITGFQPEYLATKAELLQTLPVCVLLYTTIRMFIKSQKSLDALGSSKWFAKVIRERMIWMFFSCLSCWASLGLKQSGILLGLYVVFWFFHLRKWHIVFEWSSIFLVQGGLIYLGIAFMLHRWDWITDYIFHGWMQVWEIYLEPRLDANDPQAWLRMLEHSGMMILHHGGLWVAWIIALTKVLQRTASTEYRLILLMSTVVMLGWFQGGSNLFYYYYIPALPVLALLFAQTLTTDFLLFRAAPKTKAGFRWFLLMWILIPASLWLFLHGSKMVSVENAASIHSWQTDNSAQNSYWFHLTSDAYTPSDRIQQVLHWLEQYVPQEDSIYIWADYPEVYYFSHRIPVSNILFPEAIPHKATDVQNTLITAWQNHNVRWILDLARDGKHLNQYRWIINDLQRNDRILEEIKLEDALIYQISWCLPDQNK